VLAKKVGARPCRSRRTESICAHRPNVEPCFPSTPKKKRPRLSLSPRGPRDQF
jgi:hypothetical protein